MIRLNKDMTVDWSNLLPEIVSTIAKEVKIYEDFINFVGACRSWRCAVAEDESFVRPGPLASQFPFLMLAESEDEQEKQHGYRGFFLFSNGGHTRMVKFPEARNQRCVSSRGWLLFVGEDEFEAKLVHPRSRVKIDLPDLSTFPEYDVHNYSFGNRHCMTKAVLTSSDPLSDSFFRVYVIWGSTGKLGFCNPGDASWTNVEVGWKSQICDITYHNGHKQLYTINCRARIQACHIDSSKEPANATLQQIAVVPIEFSAYWFYSSYILEWDYDKVLVVTRQVDYIDEVKRDVYKTMAFHVFVVDLRDGKCSKLESLGNRAIFLGYNSSFSVKASNDGCTVKANCIYFTDDCNEFYWDKPKGGGRDMGVFHLSDGTVEPHFKQESLCVVSPPIWVEPSHVT